MGHSHRRLPARRRVLALLLYGLAYVVYGFGVLWHPTGLPGPLWLSGVLLLAGGLYALYAAALDGVRREWTAFTVLVGVAILQALGHAGAWVLNTGHPDPWRDMLEWFVVAAFAALVGGWPETPSATLHRLAPQVKGEGTDQ